LSANFRWKGRRPPITVGVRKLKFVSWLASKIRSAFFGFVTKYACDGRTDGQIDKRTDRITTAKPALA